MTINLYKNRLLVFITFIIALIISSCNYSENNIDENNTHSFNYKKPGEIQHISQPKPFKATKDYVTEVEFSTIISKPIIRAAVSDPHKPIYKPIIDTININGYPIDVYNNFKPKIYHIPTKGYTINYGDTIYPLKRTNIKFPKNRVLNPMKSAFNSLWDLKYLSKESGLPTSNYRCVIKDSKDYLWFGSVGKGLIRYDGSNYLHFNKNNGLNINYVNCLLEDKNQNLWIGSKEFDNQQNKLIKYDGYYFYEYDIHPEFSNYPIRNIFEDSKGAIWVGTEGGGVFVVKKGETETITKFTKNNGLLSDFVYTFWENDNGEIWIGTDKGLNIFSDNKFSSFSENIKDPIKSIIQDNYGQLCFTSKNTLYKYVDNSIITFKNEKALQDISDITLDQNGTIWISNWQSGLTFFNGEKLGRITENSGLKHSRIQTLINDNSGNLWFSNPSGIYKLNLNSFNNYPIIANLSNKSITGFSLDNSNNLWLSSREMEGLIKYDYSGFQHYYVKDSESSFVYNDSKNNVWFGSKKGAPYQLIKFDGTELKKYKIKNFKSSNKIMGAVEDSKGVLWIASLEGLYKLNGDKLIKYNNQNKSSDRIIKIQIDKKGNKWLGTRYGLSKFNNEEFITYTVQNNLSSNYLINFTFDSNGNILLSTDQGLSLLTLDQNNSSIKESYNYDQNDINTSYNPIYTIIEDKNKNIWISTNDGISKLTPTNEIGCFKSISFTKKGGFLGENDILSAVIEDKNNTIWWGTYKGVINIDSNYKFEVKEPKVYINELEINQELIDFHRLEDTSYVRTFPFHGKIKDIKSIVAPFSNYPERLKLPYDLNHLKIKFSGIDLNSQENIQYTYKLKGNDGNWSDVSHENYAEYRNLKPGKYAFQVKAISKIGIESAIKTCNFEIIPAWWWTIWAKIFYCFLALLLIYLISQLRISILNKKIREKENLWTITNKQNKRFKDFSFVTSHNIRIAASNLTGLHNLLKKEESDKEILKMLEITDNKLQNSIEHINQLLNIDELSCEQEKQLISLKLSVKNVLQKNSDLIEKQKAKIHLEIPDDLKIYTVSRYLDNILHQILKNALLYGITENQKDIHIHAEFVYNKIIVRVMDYGSGINLDLYQNKMFTLGGRFHEKLCDGEGLGLYIAKNQIDTLGGDIEVKSQLNKGATFRILFYDQKKENTTS